MPSSIVPFHAFGFPVVEPLVILRRIDEELHLHLFEFAGAEDEIAGGDFVAEGFADLGDTERHFLAGGPHDVEEVDIDALRGFGTHVDNR